jgi:hypothetical protein
MSEYLPEKISALQRSHRLASAQPISPKIQEALDARRNAKPGQYDRKRHPRRLALGWPSPLMRQLNKRFAGAGLVVAGSALIEIQWSAFKSPPLTGTFVWFLLFGIYQWEGRRVRADRR